MLVEAQTEDGQTVSTMLQNAGEEARAHGMGPPRGRCEPPPHRQRPCCPPALGQHPPPRPKPPNPNPTSTPIPETVRLVGPAAAAEGGSSSGASSSSGSGGSGQGGWRAVSVSQLAPGDRVLVLQQAGARHTGIAIQERISEL
jgi:hypothetical protein